MSGTRETPAPFAAAAFAFQVSSPAGADWSTAIDLPLTATEDFVAAAHAPGRLVLAGADTSTYSGDTVAVVLELDLGASPLAYCAAKASPLGCAPGLRFAGQSSAAATSGFTVSVQGAVSQSPMALLLSLTGPSTTPFQGGTLCVRAPLVRTPLQDTGGGPQLDCSGGYALDLNAYAQGLAGGAPPPALALPGTTVWLQGWGRDPLDPLGTSLSNALRYVVLP